MGSYLNAFHLLCARLILGCRWDRRNPDRDLRDRRTPVRSGSATFSAGSEDSYSDGGEVLPMSSPVVDSHAESGGYGPNGTPLQRSLSRASLTNLAGADWSFKAVDERYLLPLFSNSVASRSSNARRASRRAAMGLDEVDSPRDESDGDFGDGVDEDRTGSSRRKDFTASVSNFFSSQASNGRSNSSATTGQLKGATSDPGGSSPR